MHGTPLQERKTFLKQWINEHSAASITLMSFGRGILSSREFRLDRAKERQEALQWIDSLRIQRGRYSYVWDSCRIVLSVASELFLYPDRSVFLHVLTDAQDNNEGSGDLKSILQSFPHATREPQTSTGQSGDFIISLKKARTPPPTDPPTPTPTATSTAKPSATPSPSATAKGTEAATPTASANSTPTPTPIATPITTPCSSVSPCDAKTAFGIQEPRVVYDGQFVQFTNNSIPRADSYVWTVTRDSSSGAECSPDYEKSPAARRSTEEHWGYRFSNLCSEPQSYSVNLTATYGATKVSATPITVIVHRRPAERFWNSIPFWGPIPLPSVSELATLVTGIGTILTTIASFRKRTPDPNVPGSRERAQQARSRSIYFLIVFMVLFTFFATRSLQQTVDPRLPIMPVNVSASTGFLPGVLPSSSTVVIRDGGSSLGFIPALSGLMLVALLVISVVIALRPRGSDDWRGRLADAVLPTGFGSLTARLIEIQRFEASGVFSKRQMRPFYRVLFKELRRKHDVPPEQRRLSGIYKKLIERLVDATQNGALTWQTLPDPATPTEITTLGKQETTEISLGTGPSLFGSKIDLTAKEPAADSIRIEVSDTNGSIRLRILTDNGIVMQSLDADSFNLDQETRDEIRRLYDVARDSALKIETTLKNVVAELDKGKAT
jgi:hypothetical protein